MSDSSKSVSPAWWNDGHSSTWERVKEALRRDWEQTKADFSHGKKGHELNQSVGDTVKQSAGKEVIPPPATPNVGTWDESQDAVRFGHGAASHYADHQSWTSELEGKLQSDWDALKSGRPFTHARDAIRHGFDRARSKI